MAKTEPATPAVKADPEVNIQAAPLQVTEIGNKFVVGSESFDTRERAEVYLTKLKELEAVKSAPDITDLPPSPEYIAIHENTLTYRNNLRELPMNEPYLPDGTYNDMYDRVYKYGWLAHRNPGAVASARSKGWEFVAPNELDKMFDEGKIPRHYSNVFRREGTYVVFADDILARIPRYRYRQLQEAKEKAALKGIQAVDEANRTQEGSLGRGARKQVAEFDNSVKFE